MKSTNIIERRLFRKFIICKKCRHFKDNSDETQNVYQCTLNCGWNIHSQETWEELHISIDCPLRMETIVIGKQKEEVLSIHTQLLSQEEQTEIASAIGKKQKENPDICSHKT